MMVLLRSRVFAGACAIGVLLSSSVLYAQRSDLTFVELRDDGNNRMELRAKISEGFDGRASIALTSVAVSARLNITYEPTLAGLATRLAIRPHNRTVAVALLEIARAANLRMLVSSRGQIVVEAMPKAPAFQSAKRVEASVDTVGKTPVTLQGVNIQEQRPELGGFRNEPGVTTFTATNAALHAMPTFVEPDVLRSVQTLPGVQSRSDWTAGFNVRGGESDQTAVLLDGFPVYNPFHAGGLFSAFVDPMIGGIELHSGALPARYGGRLSAVLDVKSAAPVTSDLGGTVSVSLASSSITTGKMFDDGNGGWTVGARRTYVDWVLRALGQGNVPFHFEDGSARLTRRIWKGVNVGITAYGARDVLGKGNSVEDANGGWSNGMVGVSLSKTSSKATQLLGVAFDSVTVEQKFSVSTFGASLDIPSYESVIENAVRDWRTGRSITAHRTKSATTLGYELANQTHSYSASSAIEDWGRIIPFDSLSQQSSSLAAYVEQVWRPSDSWLMNAGGRFEQSQTENGLGFSPRASIKYFVSPTFALSAGGGRVTQIQHSLGRDEEVLQPLQFWVLSDSARGASTVKDASVRIEKWTTPSRLLQLSAYYKKYDRLLIANRYSDPHTPNDAFVTNTGTSSGAEVMARQLDGGPFSGWASYAYAFGKRTDEYGRTIPAAQDRRHNLNLVGSWKRTRYSFGGRINVASGLPSTEVLGEFTQGYYDPATQRWVAIQASTISGVRNSNRLPFYKRIDLSVTRTGHMFGGESSTYLSVVNVLNFKNPAGYEYDFGSNATRLSIPNLPLIPTVGIKIVF